MCVCVLFDKLPQTFHELKTGKLKLYSSFNDLKKSKRLIKKRTRWVRCVDVEVSPVHVFIWAKLNEIWFKFLSYQLFW